MKVGAAKESGHSVSAAKRVFQRIKKSIRRSWCGVTIELVELENPISMARGWESKSVESQIESSVADRSSKRVPRSMEENAKIRRREDLQLSRKRLLTQIASSSNARYTDILKKALADLEGKLSHI